VALAQALHDSGHARKFAGEGGEDGKPQAMPVPDANTNKHYYGRSGKLKAGRSMNLGGDATKAGSQSIKSVQKSRKRK
jgi:hypothetical protein